MTLRTPLGRRRLSAEQTAEPRVIASGIERNLDKPGDDEAAIFSLVAKRLNRKSWERA